MLFFYIYTNGAFLKSLSVLLVTEIWEVGSNFVEDHLSWISLKWV